MFVKHYAAKLALSRVLRAIAKVETLLTNSTKPAKSQSEVVYEHINNIKMLLKPNMTVLGKFQARDKQTEVGRLNTKFHQTFGT